MQPQLLDLFVTSPSFNNFISFNNEQIVKLLQTNNNNYIHIVGAMHSGKTHLLTAWVREQHQNTAIYVDAAISKTELRDLTEKYTFIAVDNVEHLDDEGQIELFDLFNKIKLNNLNKFLVTSSSANLETIKTLRIDLKTRLLSGICLNLKALNDMELQEALAVFIAKEGITLGIAEQNYLITHYTRNLGVLIQTIHKLAETAIMKKRNITIPLIKEVLT